jgi:hypothetical protein
MRLTFSLPSEINTVIYPQRVMLPIQVGHKSPLQIIKAIFPKLNLLDWVLQPAADYNDSLASSKFKK